MNQKIISYNILLSGNSGDGIQFIGKEFTNTSVKLGYYVSTLTDYPAEIRSPNSTIYGISDFQIHFSNQKINCVLDIYDLLFVMNAASLKKNIFKLKKNGIIIADKSGFSIQKIFLAGYKKSNNPLNNIKNIYTIYEIDFENNITNIIKKYSFNQVKKYKNIFILGFIYYIYNFSIIYTKNFLIKKFINNITIQNINIELLDAGFNFGIQNNINYKKLCFQQTNQKNYKKININGNKALALGLIAGSNKSKLNLFYSSYPITPASNISNILLKFNIKVFPAEDEISAITSAIGASYAGNIGVIATSGPGMSLIQESIGLAVILELPLIIINVQRAGPSTGLPTKTEQSDLMQAIYGRHGEAPVPVISARSPSHCFEMAFNAIKIAIEHMTPIILLSDSYLANGSELFNCPILKTLPDIKIPNFNFYKKKYYPYLRNNISVRPWIIPGIQNYEHTIGSLEKDYKTGLVSYDAHNHQMMTNLRLKKIQKIAEYIPIQNINNKKIKNNNLLLLSWGSTYGVINYAVQILINENYPVSHIHIDYLFPLPMGLNELIIKFKIILVLELNNGQLVNIIRNKYLVNTYSLNKIQGIPFNIYEIIKKVKSLLLNNNLT